MGVPAFFNPILQNMNPQRDGDVARVSLDRRQLATIFTQAMLAAALSGNQGSGQQAVTQSPVAADWTETDAATDAAAAQMRLILQAIRAYDQEHQALPGSLDDLVNAKLLPGAEILHDPRSGRDNGFTYVKPPGAARFSDIKNTATPLLYESKNGQPDLEGLIGHADGRVAMAK